MHERVGIMWLCVIVIIITSVYAGTILYLRSGWLRTQLLRKPESCDIQKSLSIIVAFRNEEAKLPLLIESLVSQSLRVSGIILVNDHSTDQSVQVAEKLISNHKNTRLLHLPDGIEGKKEALRFAAREADGDYLLFTDADCSFGADMAQSMLECALTTGAPMVSGPVLFSENGSFFQRLQQLEFLSLITTGACGISKNRAILCNGANMMVKRGLYLKYSENQGKSRSSGDDIFLLHTLKKTQRIAFCYDKKAIVTTAPASDFAEFVSQRIRWASKTGSYHDADSLILAGITLLASVCLLTSAIVSIVIRDAGACFFIVFTMKTLTDALFLQPAIQYFSMQHLYKYIIPLALIYPFYYLGIGLAALVKKPKWKNRKIT